MSLNSTNSLRINSYTKHTSAVFILGCYFTKKATKGVPFYYFLIQEKQINFMIKLTMILIRKKELVPLFLINIQII